MGLVDEVASQIGYKPKEAAPAEEEYAPSTYNPLYAYPENLMHALRRSGQELRAGAQELSEGRYGRGAWDIGMGALGVLGSPLEAGIQLGTIPLARNTGIPEWALTMPAMLAAPAGYGRLAKGLGRAAEALAPSRAGAEAAGMAGAAPAAFGPMGETAASMPNLNTWQEAMMRSGARQRGGMPPLSATHAPAWEERRLLPPPGAPMPGGMSAADIGISGPFDPVAHDMRRFTSPPRPVTDTSAPIMRMGDYSTADPVTGQFPRLTYQPRREGPMPEYSWSRPQYTSEWTPEALARQQQMREQANYFRGVIGSPSTEAFEAGRSARQFMGIPETRPAKQIAPRGERPSEAAARGARADELRGSAEAARASMPSVEAAMTELRPTRQLTQEELSRVRAEETKRGAVAASRSDYTQQEINRAIRDALRDKSYLRVSDLKKSLPGLGNRPLARAIEKFGEENPSAVIERHVTESGEGGIKGIKWTASTDKFKVATEKATESIKNNLADHGMTSGRYLPESLKEAMMYPPGGSHRGVSSAHADKIIRDWTKSGIITKVENPDGSIHLLVNFEVD